MKNAFFPQKQKLQLTLSKKIFSLKTEILAKNLIFFLYLPKQKVLKNPLYLPKQKFLKYFYIYLKFIIYNIFVCTQLVFHFYLLGDFYIISNHILIFHFSLPQKDIDSFQETFFQTFLCIFDNIQLTNLQKFLYFRKKCLYKN